MKLEEGIYPFERQFTLDDLNHTIDGDPLHITCELSPELDAFRRVMSRIEFLPALEVHVTDMRGLIYRLDEERSIRFEAISMHRCGLYGLISKGPSFQLHIREDKAAVKGRRPRVDGWMYGYSAGTLVPLVAADRRPIHPNAQIYWNELVVPVLTLPQFAQIDQRTAEAVKDKYLSYQRT